MVLALKDTADFPISTKTLIDNDANFNYDTHDAINAYDRTYLDIINANRTKFFPYDKVLIERSTDSGSTWTTVDTSGFSNENRGKLMSDIGANLYIGTGNAALSQQLRVTLQFPGTAYYCSVDRAFFRFSNSGHSCSVTIDASTYGAQSTYTTLAADKVIAGWSGNNMVKFTEKRAWGTNNSSHLYNIRFTFKYTSINASYPTNQANIQKIDMFGQQFWGTSNSPQHYGHLYSWDYLKNVTFPANVTAPIVKTGTASSNALVSYKLRSSGDGDSYYHGLDLGYGGHNQWDFYEYGGIWNFWRNQSGTATTDTNNLALGITLDNVKNKSYTYTWPNKTGTIAVTSDLDAKVNIANIDITGQTTTLLALTKALGTNGINYARWYSRTDGGTSGISDKPTGGVNASFICEAVCSRWNNSSDYSYHLTCWVQTDTNPYVASITQNSSSISWSRLKPTVNDATLTIQKNGTNVQTFTANQSTNATANITVPTSFSDLTGTISNSQLDWATMCAPGAENLTDTMGATYTRFVACINSIRSVFGGHGFIFSGFLDLGGASGATTIAKTAIPGLSGYYGYKTNSAVPIAPNTTMLYSSAGFYCAWTPGAANGGNKWYGSTTNPLAISTDGYIYLNATTSSSDSVASWERLQFRYPCGLYMIDH